MPVNVCVWKLLCVGTVRILSMHPFYISIISVCVGFRGTQPRKQWILTAPTLSISNTHTLTETYITGGLRGTKLIQIQNSEESNLVNMGIAHRPHFAYFESVCFLCYKFRNISVSELGDPRQSLQLDTRRGACQTIRLLPYTTHLRFKRKAAKKVLQVLRQIVCR